MDDHLSGLISFKPVTSGELLFQFIVNELFLSNCYASVRALSMLEIGARGDQLSQYFVGMSAMNVLGRCIKKAQRVRTTDNDVLHHSIMVFFIQTILGISKKGDDVVDQLARLSLQAASVSGRPVSLGTKKVVIQGREEVPCYICGTMCLRVTQDRTVEIQYEHLWPSSFGGESAPENLLPSCGPCNQKKEAMMLWHTGHLFSFVLKPEPSEDEWSTVNRREKIARYMKTVFEVACDKACTLKDAAITIGPANTRSMQPIERADAVDFFNFNLG